MRKTLTSLALGGALAAGCTTTPILKNQDFIYGSKIDSVSNNDYKSSIPILDHSGLNFVPMFSRNRQGDELPFIGKPYGVETSWIEIDESAGSIDVDPKTIFTFPRYLVEKRREIPDLTNPEATVTEIYKEPAKEVEFVALRARKAGTPRPKKNPAFSVKTITHKDWEYDIRTAWIDDDDHKKTPKVEFYAPFSTNENGAIESRFLIPVQNTKKRINSANGRIVLRSNDIHFFNEMPFSDYLARSKSNQNLEQRSGESPPEVIVR
jgi:hypothetical protein